MKNTMLLLLLMGVESFAGCYDLEIQADETKINGSKWDKLPGSLSLPDLQICIKDGKKESCLAPCNNDSIHCQIMEVHIKKDIFELTVLDRDSFTFSDDKLIENHKCKVNSECDHGSATLKSYPSISGCN